MDDPPLLALHGVCKRFGTTHALVDVDLEIRAGEVVALVGDSGAGKSTLVKVISGAESADRGVIRWEGRDVKVKGPLGARILGIETVYQDLAMCENLDIVGNLFLGREIHRADVLDEVEMEQRARELAHSLSIRVPDLHLPVSALSSGQRQTVAIFNSLLGPPRLVLLDEPTASLDFEQTNHLLDIIDHMRDSGRGVLIISHNMADIKAVADRVMVLRLGRNNGFFNVNTTSQEQILSAVTGASDHAVTQRRAAAQEPLADTADGGAVAPEVACGPPRHRVAESLRHHAGTAWRSLGGGNRGPALVILGLLAMWLVFQSLNDDFLSPRNLSALSEDIVGTGLVAVGVVFVLVIGEIDLAVGSLSGLSAAVFAVLNVNLGMPEWLAVICGLACGTAVGGFHGFLFARIGVPAFVVTLAGLLIWNGVTLLLLGASGGITLDQNGLVASLTSSYFSDHGAAYGLAALGVAVYLLGALRDRNRRRAAGMPYGPPARIWVRTAALAVVGFAAALVLNRFRGLPLALLIFLVILAGSDYLLRRTRHGRQIFALGGGVKAALRAGVKVTRVRISMFMVSGTLAALGGLFVASELTSAVPTTARAAGSGTLLINAIAAAVIGGTSLFGGRGSPWSALLGVLVIQSIASGMELLDVETTIQFVITGGVLLAAVTVDTLSRRARQAHGGTEQFDDDGFAGASLPSLSTKWKKIT